MDVLVLNRNFFAIQITSWQRALLLVYLDRASIVDEEYRTYSFSDWCELSQIIKENPAGFVHTPKFKIAIPEVIALKFYDKIPLRDVKFTRRNIYEHYGHRCCYCGKKFPINELNLDHVVPRSRGGKTEWTNVVTSCIKCNLKKGNSLPEEVGMSLVIKPSKPTNNPCLGLILRSPIKVKSSWQKFIDNVYWNIELDEE
ncbi:MAG: HNH endonuclease [Endomicrobiia bacterium]